MAVPSGPQSLCRWQLSGEGPWLPVHVEQADGAESKILLLLREMSTLRLWAPRVLPMACSSSRAPQAHSSHPEIHSVTRMIILVLNTSISSGLQERPFCEHGECGGHRKGSSLTAQLEVQTLFLKMKAKLTLLFAVIISCKVSSNSEADNAESPLL